MRYIWTVMLTIYIAAPQLTARNRHRCTAQKFSGCSLHFTWTVIYVGKIYVVAPQLTQIRMGTDTRLRSSVVVSQP
jgi:hypothetical protein